MHIHMAQQWIQPRPQDIKKEYELEYIRKVKPFYGDIFPTLKDFTKAVTAAKVTEISKSDDRQIENRSHTKTMKGLLSLIKTYASYPKYRNKDTLAALDKRIKDGESMTMPFVLEFSDGTRRIMGGNTRMDIGFWYASTVTVLIIKVPELYEGKLLSFGEWNVTTSMKHFCQSNGSGEK